MGVFSGHLYQTQNRFMMGVEGLGEFGVDPIDGQSVLGEIVGPDGEEIHVGGQDVRDYGRSRGLDHDAKFHIRVEFLAPGGEVRFSQSAHLLYKLDLA